MKIHFDNVAPVGTGPGTFADRLARCLFEMGHTVVTSARDAVVSLVFIERSGRDLAPKVVQRLDGIWFKPEEFTIKNVGIRSLYDVADAVVWQSEFDRAMSMKHFGPRRQGHDEVIHNGIDINPVTALTIPALVDLRAQYDQVFVCSANWHPQKRLAANVRLFERLRKHEPNSCLIILGNNPDCRATGPNVFYAGSVGPDVYNQIYSAANWMLHLAWADHCPNVVIEALAQGTPVACSEVGGTKELIGSYGLILKEDEYDFSLFDYDRPPTIDVDQVTRLPSRSTLDYGSIADIDIRHVAARYVSLFEKLVM